MKINENSHGMIIASGTILSVWLLVALRFGIQFGFIGDLTWIVSTIVFAFAGGLLVQGFSNRFSAHRHMIVATSAIVFIEFLNSIQRAGFLWIFKVFPTGAFVLAENMLINFTIALVISLIIIKLSGLGWKNTLTQFLLGHIREPFTIIISGRKRMGKAYLSLKLAEGIMKK